jgi:hypothetical protein
MTRRRWPAAVAEAADEAVLVAEDVAAPAEWVVAVVNAAAAVAVADMQGAHSTEGADSVAACHREKLVAAQGEVDSAVVLERAAAAERVALVAPVQKVEAPDGPAREQARAVDVPARAADPDGPAPQQMRALRGPAQGQVERIGPVAQASLAREGQEPERAVSGFVPAREPAASREARADLQVESGFAPVPAREPRELACVQVWALVGSAPPVAMRQEEPAPITNGPEHSMRKARLSAPAPLDTRRTPPPVSPDMPMPGSRRMSYRRHCTHTRATPD